MDLPKRNSVKVILLNRAQELLLVCTDDSTIKPIHEEYRGRFWSLVGGKIESGESTLEAAAREVYEETGISSEKIEFGPVVWYGNMDLILHGVATHIHQCFIVAKTVARQCTLENVKGREKDSLKSLKWFSLDKINNCNEIIYPVSLGKYLFNILIGKYPDNPIEIDLSEKPK